MLTFLKNLFTPSPSVDLKELVKKGAVIIDVRTPGEFAGGHIKGSKNIPLQSLPNKINKISKTKPVILCCASGARSGSAKRMLKAQGFTDVHNGGGWHQLQHKIN